MNTTFIISGGAGRVITAVPALEKYARLNPEDDFKVLVYGWENLFWSHPILQNRTFSIGQKGVFDQFIKNNKVVSPEPYYSYGYYNQKLSLAEAFDELINNTDDHRDLQPPRLYVSTFELASALSLINAKKQEKNKNKVVVFQPYGSGMTFVNGRPFDNSHRSMDVDDYMKLVSELEKLNQDVLVVFFGDKQFDHPGDTVSVIMDPPGADLRMYLSLIKHCDYFVGCDSVGQHMARSFDKPGLVLMGATDEKNVSYPDHFTIYRNKSKAPTYSPIRLSGIDCEFADRMNDQIMKFSDDQIREIARIINRGLYEQ